MNFSAEISVAHVADKLGPLDSLPIIARFETDNLVEITKYITEAMDYFGGMVQFDSNVTYAGILVRVYQDHHTINMDRDAEGKLRVRSNY